MSNKLIKYLTEFENTRKKLSQKYGGDILVFDSIFESGNLFQVDAISTTEY